VQSLEADPKKPQEIWMAQFGAETKKYWRQWENLRILGGVLYMKFESDQGDKYHVQAILPRVLKNEFLMKVHCHKMAGHLGVKKTQHRVMQRAYWFKLWEDVERFCRQCYLCASQKPSHRKSRAPMQQHLMGLPMGRVSLNIMGPLPKSDNDNKFVLHVCDYFTKWVEAFPIPNQEAKTIANRFVKELVC
jgi:hypothetical protein